MADLADYRRKRDFARTPEPPGTPGTAEATATARFVVQRHRATRLHYDLRLEMDGVLASWAVPKGPTLDPKTRRSAFHVEDHPLDYIDFEGVIPAGGYGGGDVIVWDTGTWELHPHHKRTAGTANPVQLVRDGELHFDLYGQKLRGRFVLVRTNVDASGKEQWLLLHKNDEHAVPGWNTEEHPASVLSGRTNDEVAAEPDRVWTSSTKLATAESLAALDEFGKQGDWEVFGRRLRVTNLDKELFAGVTKRDLLRYTAQVAPVALPYLTGRALNLHRFPDGERTAGFWQKELPRHAPDWLPRWDNPAAGPGETHTYLVAGEPAALVWAVNFGGIEWHPWTSRTEAPACPTYALIDLDPGRNTAWADLLALARLHRTALQHLGVTGRPKLTGRRGIQIWIPVAVGVDFEETRAWVERLSRAIGAVVPDLVSWQWQRSERGGLARLDYTQNAVNKTLVAPYSPRPGAGAPVSAPIGWDELDDPALRPDLYTIRTMPDRIAERGDLFAPILARPQTLPPLT
jgi:bifunctional non-homologous end joining protein LigD